jgi:hypothetical protein
LFEEQGVGGSIPSQTTGSCLVTTEAFFATWLERVNVDLAVLLDW